MIKDNYYLTKEIMHLKRSKFPELKYVLVMGVYLPWTTLAEKGSGGSMTFDGLGFGIKDNALKLGYGFLKILDYLAGNINHDARIGILSHELSHLICSKTISEYSADEEVVKRGLGHFFYTALKKRESMGIGRLSGYNSSQIFNMLKSSEAVK